MYQSLPLTKKYIAKLLLLCLVFHLCLGISGQSTGRVIPKINLSAKNVTITDIFKAIKSQTGKIVWFMNEEVNADKKVTVNFENASLDEVMKTLFGASSDFTWSFDEEKVILRKKKQNSDDVIISNVGSPSVRVDSVPATITVSGKVTDEKGSPIIGATVLVKGTRIGTTTGADGGFVLEGVKPRAVLTVTSISYLSKDVPLQGKSSIGSISLKEFVKKLDEAVVIAYGTTTQRISTGNVSVVSGDEIRKQPVTNLLLALQGRISGLVITQSTGLSGTGVKVLIQGQNSIGNGNDPFYVIDGVPFTSQLLPNLGNILGTSKSAGYSLANNGNPLNYINPSDIESISVLKDADATAIYGSKAANGAILITTKKGKSGQTKVDVNIQSGWGEITRKLDLLSTKQYLDMRYEALKNDGNIIQPFDYDLVLWDTTRRTDWQKELIGGTAGFSDMQISVSGGNESTQFLIGTGYHKETTTFPGSFSDQKGSIHFNVNNVSINQKFNIQFLGSYLIDNNRLPNTDLTFDAISLAPNAPTVYNLDGSLNWMQDEFGTSTFINPLRYLYNKYQNKTSNLVCNSTMSYQILPNLNIKSSFGYNNLQSNETVIYPLIVNSPEERAYIPRISNYSNNNINSWIIEPQINYKINLGGGRIEALLGTTIQQNNSNGLQMDGVDYVSDGIMEDIKSASNVAISSTVRSVYKYNAIFARLSYNWKEKYAVNITTRRDGSSRFGRENQFHNFGSVAGMWIFSNEKFIQQNLSFISFGKLRASYGTTGNDQIGDYQFLNLYNPMNVGVNYQGVKGLEVNNLPNPYLQWEETRKINLGFDLGLFRERILLSGIYFQNRSSNQLLSYSLPIITGFNSIISNFPATVRNFGLEFTLTTSNLKSSSFSWTSNLNFTLPKNKLIAFPNLESSSYAGSLFIGQPLSQQRVYHFIGVEPESGVYQFADSHGSPTFKPDYLTDRTISINTSPKFYGGLQNNFKYKGFELSLLFQFVKQVGENYKFGSSNIAGSYYFNQPISVLNRWQKSGDIKTIQRYNSNYSISEQLGYVKASDAAFTDASFIRFKNIAFSWTVPDIFIKRMKLQSCRLYMQGQNLLTMTNFSGMDPENQSVRSLPPLRVLTFGIQAIL